MQYIRSVKAAEDNCCYLQKSNAQCVSIGRVEDVFVCVTDGLPEVRCRGRGPTTETDHCC